MKFKVHFKINEDEDYIIIEGDDIIDYRHKMDIALKKRRANYIRLELIS